MPLNKIYKIVTYLPQGDDFPTTQEFVAELNEKLPLAYGNYDMVAYYGDGTEQYRPLEGSKPASGEVDKISTHASQRLEFSIPRSYDLLKQYIRIMEQIHPWNSPVINAYEGFENRSAKD